MKMFSRILFLIIVAAVGFGVASFAAEEREITGQLVSLDTTDKTLTVEVEVKGLTGPEKKFMNMKIASDARWHICLTDRCVNAKGMDGFKKLNEYTEYFANYEAYGVPYPEYRVTLKEKEGTVTSVRIEIEEGKHL